MRLVDVLKQETGNQHLSTPVADLSDLAQSRKFALDLAKSLGELDVLINNAGVFLASETRTKEGLDVRFAVNYFAPILLTEALLPLLEKSKDPRVINLSSAAQSPVDLEVLVGNKAVTDNVAYAQSKLALTMWNNHIAKANPKITFIPLNPGSLLNTRMVQEAYGQHWAPVTKGADILEELALGDQHREKSGVYFDNDEGRYGRPHADAEDEAKIEELMRLTDEVLSKLSE